MSIEFKHKAENPEHLIIFVHGLGGDKFSFVNTKDTYFHIYFEDCIKDHCDIAYYEYTSKAVTSKIMSFFSNLTEHLAKAVNHEISEISDILKTDCINHMNKYTSINFICHSMGGLIVKDLLVSKELNFNKKPFYITLATPHYGSKVADRLIVINGLHTQIKQLKTNAFVLTALNKEFKYQKDKFKRKYYFALDDTIVAKDCSYSEGEEILSHGVEGNHTSISKPNNKDSQTLLLNINDTIKTFLGIGDKKKYKSSLIASVLFESCNNENRKYYIHREIDKKIKKILRIKNLWLYAESGIGKTNIAQYYGYNNSREFFHSSYFIDSYSNHEDYFQFIYESILDRIGEDLIISESLSVHMKLTKVLCHLSNTYKSVTLHFDELSEVASSNTELFFTSLIDMLTSKTDECNLDNINIIITTLFNPEESIMSIKKASTYEKIKSKFEFLELSKWTSFELKGLYNMISHELDIKIENINNKLSELDGNPRKLKELIREEIIAGEDNE